VHVDGSGDSDRGPLLIKHVQHEDGTEEDIVVGQSTLPQTIFNSVNVLIGIGLLSLPLAMKHAGWVLGLVFLIFSAVATSYTAKILAKCLDVDRSVVTYADLAYISFGQHARLITSFLFCLELLGACVALVVLFADSLYALVPGLSILQWKIVCGVVLLPLNFLPLRFLSITSILGIISCTSSKSSSGLGLINGTDARKSWYSFASMVLSSQMHRAPCGSRLIHSSSLKTGLLSL
jgi:vesicular inhibitory amino acid transporter